MRFAAFVLFVIGLTNAALAQTTAFTYQGELRSGSALANGLHDVRFRLFDAMSAGAQVGSTICVDDVPVIEGRFSVTIDFGGAFASTAARFIEIEVRADTGLDCANTTGYTTLSPRQAITPAPRAAAANTAFSLSAPDGSPSNVLVVDNEGDVGIGTASPSARLEVVGGPIQVTSAGDQADLLWFASERSWVVRQEGAGATAALKFQSAGGGGNKNFIIQTDGLVGVGTTSPTAKLDVRGDIRLGSTGQYLAPAATENLRIIRGAVFSDGNIQAGSGFSVTPTNTGIYTVTFAQPFLSMPVVTAAARSVPTQSVMNVVNIDNVTSTSFQVRVTWISGSLQNGPFHFIAVGPR
ncbi:MAG: hypothetical protein AB7Q00_10465 [Phycisphaerales bacterium]